MPYLRRPIRPPRNLPPVPVNHSPSGILAPTILPNTIVPVTTPLKLPPRPIRGHPLGTMLTVPTVGPLPPLAETIVPTIVNDPTVLPPRPVVPRRAPPPGMFRRPNAGVPFIPGMPLVRAPYGRVPFVRR